MRRLDVFALTCVYLIARLRVLRSVRRQCLCHLPVSLACCLLGLPLFCPLVSKASLCTLSTIAYLLCLLSIGPVSLSRQCMLCERLPCKLGPHSLKTFSVDLTSSVTPHPPYPPNAPILPALPSPRTVYTTKSHTIVPSSSFPSRRHHVARTARRALPYHNSVSADNVSFSETSSQYSAIL